jgi:Sigma-70, region 4
MLRSDPCISASCALSARLMQAGFPPQAYAPPPEGKTQTLDRSTRVTQVPTTPSEPSRASVGPNTRIAQDGVRSRLRVIDPAPTAQRPDAVRRLNSGSSPGTDQQLRSQMADAMRQLPFEHRAVIYRAYYQGWTTSRIADDLCITEADVRSRLHDGLRTLRLSVQRMRQRR